MYITIWKFLRTAIKNAYDIGYVRVINETQYLNKNFCNIDLNNFMIIFFFMYKKHELIIGFIFWNKHFETYANLLKNTQKTTTTKKIKMAESSRSISPIKKKVKRSKLAGMTMPIGVIAIRRSSCETAHVTFFCDIKCAVFLLNI